jgi:hypothetical protein
MTTDQYIAKLNAASRKLQNPKGLVGVASAVGRLQHKRIFEDGKDGKGADIKPEYSTKPIYIGKSQTPKQNLVKTYEGGYKEFKGKLGRGKMVLFRFFAQAYLGSLVRPDVQFSDRGVVITSGFNYTPANPKGKVDGLLDKYGDAFKFSKDEEQLFREKARQFLLTLFE